MSKLSKVHIILAILALFAGNLLRGQSRPEMVPYRLVPSDPHPDHLLEMEIEIIQPYTVETLISVHKQETMNIIYERIEFETINPDGRNQIFEIDGKLYYLIRIPYTGVQW
jgi:hypothetical protein